MADAVEKTAETEVENKNSNGDVKEKCTDEKKTSTESTETKTENAEAAGADTEPTHEVQSLTSLEKSIIRQVEYYFGDANLNRDKFLQEQISKDENGWVALSVLITFKRLAELSTDPAVIVDALLKSDEGLIEISEDRTKLRRHPERPLPEHNEERRKEIQSRTAYCKGFPLTATMNQLLEFFAPYEGVLNINIRKYHDKPTKQYKSKGSIFVTFEKIEQAKEFIEKSKVMYNERELIRKWQIKYLEEKKEEQQRKLEKIKQQKEEQQKKEQEEKNQANLPKGAILYFENAPEDVSRELLREAISKIEGKWDIAFIDHCKGKEAGYIRFQEENNAVDLLEKLVDKKLQVRDDCELPVRVLGGDEEVEYHKKAVEGMKSARSQRKGSSVNSVYFKRPANPKRKYYASRNRNGKSD